MYTPNQSFQNRAYGRQSISQLMQIVAPIPKKNLLVRQNLQIFFFFFSQWFKTLYRQKISNLRPLLSTTFPQGFWKSKKFGHWNLESGEKRRLNGVNKWRRKNPYSTFLAAAILHPLWVKVFKSETTSLNFFSPRIWNIYKVWTFEFGKWGQKDR